jgi:hypothetical protein
MASLASRDTRPLKPGAYDNETYIPQGHVASFVLKLCQRPEHEIMRRSPLL